MSSGESNGGKFLLVFAPNKHLIYPQYLPEWFQNKDNTPTRLDQLSKYLAKADDSPFIDLRGP